MEGGAIGEAAASGRGDGEGPSGVRVQFFVHGKHAGKAPAGWVEAMLERNHNVIVALDADERLRRADRRALAELAHRHPGLDRVRVPDRIDPWRVPAGAIRRGLDYLQCLEADDPAAKRLRDEAHERAPRVLRTLLRVPPFRWEFGRRMLTWILRHVEAGLPIARAPKALISEHSPDVVVIMAAAELGEPPSDLVRAASATRTPSVLIFDGAGEGGPARIRGVPTLAVAAKQEQVNDIVRVHGLPRERTQAVGGDSDSASAGAFVEAVDEAAHTDDVPGPPGRTLRPIMWLLTPFVVLAVALLRPGATLKGLRKRRMQARRREQAESRARERERTADRKARAKAAKQEKRVRGQRKRKRAAEKRRKREARQQRERRASARAAAPEQEGE